MESLARAPSAWRFVEAVRQLERLGAERGLAPVGHDADPARESVRLRGHPSLAFAPGEIREARGFGPGEQPELRVTFLGFLGAVGVLPQHYTELAVRRIHKHKDTAFVDWLDALLHRTLSFWFRAWRKQRPLATFEQARVAGAEEGDPAERALRALTGLATKGLRDRQALPDSALLHSGGLFASTTRSAAGLAGAATAWLGRPARVRQFVARWLPIESEDRTRLPDRARPEGTNARLGRSLFLGGRVRDVGSAIHLVVGPVGTEEYRSLLPGTRGHRALGDLVRSYAGVGVDARLELAFEPRGLQQARLPRRGDGDGGGARIGQDSWIGDPKRAPQVRNEVFPLT